MKRHHAMGRMTGMGMYVPKHRFSNEELAAHTGLPVDDKFRAKLGIGARYLTLDEESTADLAEQAAWSALAAAGADAETIDLVIVATDTPEYISPATASVVQGRIGAKNAGTFDINASCAGFVTAVDVAARLTATGIPYRRVLVIGAYNMSKFVDWTDPRVFPIFADGAGAVLIEKSRDGAGLLGSNLLADGTQYDFLGIYGGGAKHPLTAAALAEKKQLLTFLKPLPPDRNIQLWPPLIKKTLAQLGLSADDVDHFFFTQINRWVIEEVMGLLAQPLDKTTFIMGEYGYTGSACIPMAMVEARKQGKIQPGSLVVLTASGVGFAVACTVFRF